MRIRSASRGLVVGLLLVACGDDSVGGGKDLALPDLATPDLVPGPPETIIPTAAIDFGMVNCGDTTAAAKMLSFTNTGGLPLTFTASIPPGGAFALMGADNTGVLMGTVPPGMSQMLTILAQVPASSTAAVALTGALTLLTSAPDMSSVTIPLSVTPQGATIVVMPSVSQQNQANANFGSVPINIAAPAIGLVLLNAGNAPVTFTVGQPTDSQFGLAGNSAPLTLAAGMQSMAVSATFTPTKFTMSTATALVSTGTTPVCGMSATGVSFAGQGSGSAISSMPGSGGTLNLGSATCGQSNLKSATVTLDNAGNAAWTFQASLGGGVSSPFKLSATMGSVPAGDMATLVVTPADVPKGATPGPANDVLTVAPTGGSTGAAITLNLSLLVQGAVLSFSSVPGTYQNVNSGAGSQAQTVTVLNSGNLAVSPTVALSMQSASYNPFALASPLLVPIQGGNASGSATVTFAPKAGDFATDTATLALVAGTGDVICGALPAPVTLTGTGQTGGFSSSTSSINFGNNGLVPCSATPMPAAPQTFTISNAGNAPYNWQATLAKGSASPYTLSPSSGIVGAKGGGADTTTITVTPKALPFPASTSPNAYGDAIAITTTIQGDSEHDIKLNQTAQGAILAFAPTSIDFGNVPVGTSAQNNLQVQNTGNAPVDVVVSAMTTMGQPEATYQVASGMSTSLPGIKGADAATVQVTFIPGSKSTDATTSTGTVAMSVGMSAVLCAPLPTMPVALTGNGTTALVSTNPQSVVTFTGPAMTQNNQSFPAPTAGNTYCGTTASTQTITFTNLGTNDYKISGATLGQGSSSPYSVVIGTNNNVTVKASGGTNTVVITSGAVPSTYSFLAPAVNFSDTVTVTTDAQNDTPHNFTIVQSPYGAVLASFFPSPSGGMATIAFPDTAAGKSTFEPFGLSNNGNAPATVAITNILSNGSAGTFTFTVPSPTLAAFTSISGSTTFGGNFNPPAQSAGTTYSGSANFGVTGTPLCAPLPLTGFMMGGKSVTPPPVSVTPSSVSFTQVPCGATLTNPATQTITISNPTGGTANWTASIPANGNGTTFKLSATSGSVAAGMSGTFTISAAPAPPWSSFQSSVPSYNNTLAIAVVTTTGTSNFSVPVAETGYGAILAFNPQSLSIAAGKNKNFVVQNYGNEDAPVALKIAVASGSPIMSLTAQTGTVPRAGAGGIAGWQDTVQDTGKAVVNNGTEDVTVNTTIPLCAPLPSALTVTQ